MFSIVPLPLVHEPLPIGITRAFPQNINKTLKLGKECGER